MAKPNSPHMLTVVEDCLEGLEITASELGVRIQGLRLDMIDDIVDVSGPRRLTRGIQKSLSKLLGQDIGNDDIGHLLEPKLIGDVLVMPDYAFADSMNQQYGDEKSAKFLRHITTRARRRTQMEARKLVSTQRNILTVAAATVWKHKQPLGSIQLVVSAVFAARCPGLELGDICGLRVGADRGAAQAQV